MIALVSRLHIDLFPFNSLILILQKILRIAKIKRRINQGQISVFSKVQKCQQFCLLPVKIRTYKSNFFYLNLTWFVW